MNESNDYTVDELYFMKAGIDIHTFENFLKGDDFAFRQVFDRYFPIIHRYILSRCRQEEEAEELTQEAFVILYRHREKMTTPEGIYPFLFVVTKRLTISHFRNQKARREVCRVDWEEAGELLSSEQTENAVDYKELRAIYEHIVSALPPKQRRIYEMFHFEDIPQKEIAEKLSISRHTVKNHLALATKTIRFKVLRYFLLFTLFFLVY